MATGWPVKHHGTTRRRRGHVAGPVPASRSPIKHHRADAGLQSASRAPSAVGKPTPRPGCAAPPVARRPRRRRRPPARPDGPGSGQRPVGDVAPRRRGGPVQPAGEARRCPWRSAAPARVGTGPSGPPAALPADRALRGVLDVLFGRQRSRGVARALSAPASRRWSGRTTSTPRRRPARDAAAPSAGRVQRAARARGRASAAPAPRLGSRLSGAKPSPASPPAGRGLHMSRESARATLPAWDGCTRRTAEALPLMRRQHLSGCPGGGSAQPLRLPPRFHDETRLVGITWCTHSQAGETRDPWHLFIHYQRDFCRIPGVKQSYSTCKAGRQPRRGLSWAASGPCPLGQPSSQWPSKGPILRVKKTSRFRRPLRSASFPDGRLAEPPRAQVKDRVGVLILVACLPPRRGHHRVKGPSAARRSRMART